MQGKFSFFSVLLWGMCSDWGGYLGWEFLYARGAEQMWVWQLQTVSNTLCVTLKCISVPLEAVKHFSLRVLDYASRKWTILLIHPQHQRVIQCDCLLVRRLSTEMSQKTVCTCTFCKTLSQPFEKLGVYAANHLLFLYQPYTKSQQCQMFRRSTGRLVFLAYQTGISMNLTSARKCCLTWWGASYSRAWRQDVFLTSFFMSFSAKRFDVNFIDSSWSAQCLTANWYIWA